MGHIRNLQNKAENHKEKLVIIDSDLIKINGILISLKNVDTDVESRMERID